MDDLRRLTALQVLQMIGPDRTLRELRTLLDEAICRGQGKEARRRLRVALGTVGLAEAPPIAFRDVTHRHV